MNNIKDKLNEELTSIQFSSEQQVFDKIRKKPRFEKVAALLNKEIEIPLVVLTVATIIFLITSTIYPLLNENNNAIKNNDFPVGDQIIEKGGSVYLESFWSSEVNKYQN